jgi:trehalose/maltose hydrolase-like predicted phosphorylase
VAGLGRTFDAVVVDGDSTVLTARGAPAAGLRRRLEHLCALGLDVVVLSSRPVAELDERLGARTTGPGHLLLSTDDGTRLHTVREDGPEELPTAGRRAGDVISPVLDELSSRGIGPGLVLVVVGSSVPWPGPRLNRATVVSVGAEAGLALDRALHLGGGLRTLAALLEEQARRRSRRHVPELDHDPAWVLDVPADDHRTAHCLESLLTLSDGVVGLRGSAEPPYLREAPSLLASGVYVDTGSSQHLLEGPWPLRPPATTPQPSRRRLDLRTGVLLQESVGPEPLRSLRFVAAGRRGLVALRAEGPGARSTADEGLGHPTSTQVVSGSQDGQRWARTSGAGGGMVAATHESTQQGPGWRTLERVVAYAADPHRPPTLGDATSALEDATRHSFDLLLRDHRETWARRWDSANVWVPDDPGAELALRFALFHLWSLASDADELAVGARGLTGHGYAGHVFWDADVFVLPALATLAPEAARAMLTYRLNRLASARAAARSRGYDGARFPWESARDGEDVTPQAGRINSAWVPILTGQLEEHIVADVAWAACRYATWTGDTAFLDGDGQPLVVETARYWASRVERDPDGSAHLRNVIGPDEYHEAVDDNVFTNVLARWNLRRGARLSDDRQEREDWLRLADALVVHYDPVRRVHEQFTGYDELEPLLVTDVGQPPVAADLVLGQERISASQVVKQPDVLMAHHLLPEELPEGSLQADLDHYLPRTAHGSSLSPAITAALLARAGRPDEALRQLDLALRLDLDDLTGVTGAGLHIATIGGVWQAVVGGFAGLRVDHSCLVVDPQLPARWPSLRLRLRCLGRVVDLDLRHDTADLRTDGPLSVRTATGHPGLVTEACHLVKSGDGWEVMTR